MQGTFGQKDIKWDVGVIILTTIHFVDSTTFRRLHKTRKKDECSVDNTFLKFTLFNIQV